MSQRPQEPLLACGPNQIFSIFFQCNTLTAKKCLLRIISKAFLVFTVNFG